MRYESGRPEAIGGNGNAGPDERDSKIALALLLLAGCYTVR